MIRSWVRIPATVMAAAGTAAAALLIARRDLRLSADALEAFKTAFAGIILEAVPFVLLGVVFSAVLQVFVSDRQIRRLTPRHPAAAILFGSLLGLLFPLCECGMVPVVRRLIRKGMPAYIGIVYIIAGPIINPVVYYSTFTAFRSLPAMAYARTGLAFAVSVAAGIVLYRTIRRDPLRKTGPKSAATTHDHDHHHDHHDHNLHHEQDHHHVHKHGHDHVHPATTGSRIASMVSHASDEFFEMGKYLIIGAALAAFVQTGAERSDLEGLSDHTLFTHLLLMGVAFLLSLCSTADAFVAASFQDVFDKGALLAFLVFGPMMDMKTALMLGSVFRARIVLGLIALTAVLVLAGSWATEALFFR